MFLSRNVTAKLAENLLSFMSQAVIFPYRLSDLPRRMILALGSAGNTPSGKLTTFSGALPASSSLSVPLPNGYVSGVALSAGGLRLRVAIRAQALLRVTIVSPDQGTSIFLLKGTNSPTQGLHEGHLIFTGTITSITLAAPSQNTYDCQYGVMLYELPDITQQAAFRDQETALGYVTSTGG
jgi:hypothetical protein